MDKRPAESPPEGTPEAKKALISPLTGNISAEDLEQFQKEAIFRQMNVYRRERDAIREELAELVKGPDADLSAIRHRYLETIRLSERPDSGTRAGSAPPQQNGDDKHESEAPAPAAEDNQEKSENVEKLEEEIAGQKGIILAQKRQIKELQERLAELEVKIRDLEMALEVPSDAVLAKSETFKLMNSKVVNLTADNSRLEQELAKLQAATVSAERKAADAEFAARKSSINEIQQLEKKLEMAETDVARLRAARDDKISEINVLKAGESERLQSLENLKSLQNIADEKVKQAQEMAKNSVDGDSNPDIESLSLEELREYAQKLAKKNKIISAELPSLELAYSKAHAKALMKVQDQAVIEAKINAANVSKAKADEKYYGAMRAKDALVVEMTRIKASLAKSADLMNTLRANEQKFHSNTQKLEKRIADGDSKLSQLQRTHVALDRRRADLEAEVAASNQQISSLKEQLKARDSEVAALNDKRRLLETQVEKMRKQLDIKRTPLGSGAVQEQLESLRTVALCSLCTNNWKNTAIKVCGHVFCSDCANARLSSRMRKCPLCNTQFGHNDLMPVHL